MSSNRNDQPQRNRVHEYLEWYFRAAPVTVPIFAVLTAMVVGSIVIFSAGANPVDAYSALFQGAFGSPARVAAALGRSTPFIVAALAVAVCFKAGLFNIGAEGQLLWGALTAAWVGTWGTLAGLPLLVYGPIMILAGIVGGAVWGFLPGFLKARTGAHEVIVTIMLNLIAVRMVEWVITSRNPVLLLDETATVPRTEPIAAGARLPQLVADTGLHFGFVIALVLCAVMWFLLNRTTVGFEINTVGTNPDAARYAGMSVPRTIILVFLVGGALAGIAGAAEVAGSRAGYLTPGVYRQIGFDAIAIALLARANPIAVIPAAILWGSLLAGAPLMQLRADLSIDVVRIVQGLIILFVAADAIVRTIFRIRQPRGAAAVETVTPSAKGWGT